MREVVVQDDVAEKRQSAGTVIRQTDGDLRPVNFFPAQIVLVDGGPLDERPVFTGKGFDFSSETGCIPRSASDGP